MCVAERNNLDAFPGEVAEVIRDGLKHGVSDDQMIKGMISIGNLMGKFVKADTPEESLIKEIWEVADGAEKETLAGLVLKVGKNRVH
jgi:hypothetical protein